MIFSAMQVATNLLLRVLVKIFLNSQYLAKLQARRIVLCVPGCHLADRYRIRLTYPEYVEKQLLTVVTLFLTAYTILKLVYH